MMDLSKVFHCVFHNIILEKLNTYYGFKRESTSLIRTAIRVTRSNV